MEFFRDVLRYPFLQYAVAAGALASVACGIVGTHVVVRRMTYIAGAISHCVLAGLGAARYLRIVHGVSWVTPLGGATVAALVAALIVGVVTLYGRQRTDTVLSVVWSLGMAIGVSFIAVTPGYSEDLMSYLFGNILMVSPADLALMATLDVVVVVAMALFHNKFVAISFNEELARLRGVHVEACELLFMVITALTVVLLVQIVGIVLVIALLTLPAASVGFFVRRMVPMMATAAALSLLITVGGLAISYTPELPAGATIVEFAGVIFLGAMIASRMRRVKRDH